MPLELPPIDLDSIPDENARRCIVALLNLIQQLAADNDTLRAENQALRDENARLKGQPPRPSFPSPPTGAGGQPRFSSEKERTKRSRRTRSQRQILIDREQILAVDPALLPADAEFKGYEDKVVQDLIVHTDNVLFHREKFYSPSLGRTFLGPVPTGYEHGFGPNLRAWVYVMYFSANTSEPNLLSLLKTAGVQMSSGQLSSLLTSDPGGIDGELERGYFAMLANCPYQHVDDTGTRVDGVGYFCHIVSSPVGTFYSTRPSKSRRTVIEVLRHETIGHFRVNDQALCWMETDGVPASTIAALRPFASEQTRPEPLFAEFLAEHAPSLPSEIERRVWDAAALADYHQQTIVPVVPCLITDDAPQFAWIALEQMLCWIHRGRNLKKLSPQVPLFQQEQQKVLGQFWALYRQLHAWQEHPAPEAIVDWEQAFDALTQQTVSYEALGKQLAQMAADREKLLDVVVRHPEIPLHNNPAELDARQRVRKRDVSFGPRTLEGAKAWDRWQSLFGTLKKLGQNAYHFVLDRLTGQHLIPPLEALIQTRADEQHLGWTWGMREAPSG